MEDEDLSKTKNHITMDTNMKTPESTPRKRNRKRSAKVNAAVNTPINKECPAETTPINKECTAETTPINKGATDTTPKGTATVETPATPTDAGEVTPMAQHNPHEHAGTDNSLEAVREQMAAMKQAHRECVARTERDIRMLGDMIAALEMISEQPDLDTPNSEGLPPCSATDFVNNLLVVNPRGVLPALVETLSAEYGKARAELEPTLWDYALWLLDPGRRLAMTRWRSTETILGNLARIRAILRQEETGAEVGINLNNFATYAGYLQVVRPQSSSAVFAVLLATARQSLERARKLLKVSRVMGK